MSERGAKQPYVRFFASDWLGGTRGMKAVEIGVYITLIALMYERREPLPDEPKKLARQCGCDERSFTKILASLIEDRKIVRSEGGLWNDRVQREFEWRAKMSGGAKEAADSRWKKNKKNNTANMRAQCDRNADAMPNPEARNQSVPNGTDKNSRDKRGSILPKNWKPSENDLAWARGSGFSEPFIAEQTEAMHDWAAANANRAVARKADWSRTWRGWLRREWPRRNRGHGPPKSRTDTAFEKIYAGFEREAEDGFPKLVRSGASRKGYS